MAVPTVENEIVILQKNNRLKIQANVDSEGLKVLQLLLDKYKETINLAKIGA